jgi:Ca2+/Na+ antiporter
MSLLEAADLCTHAQFFKVFTSAAQVCAELTKAILPGDEAICDIEYLNFYKLYFCDMPTLVGTIFLYIFLIFFIFRWTAIVVDELVVLGIEQVATTLKMSDALAAVTVMALANGAGDVITALVAGGQSGGVSYNIGSLYGAGLFVAS